MSALEGHPNVRKIDNYLFVVEGPADSYYVEADGQELGAWITVPSHDSPSRRAGNLRGRQEAEAWLAEVTTTHRSLHDALTFALTRVGVR